MQLFAKYDREFTAMTDESGILERQFLGRSLPPQEVTRLTPNS